MPASVGSLFGQHARLAVRRDLLRPRRVDERLAEQELAGRAIVHVEEAVAVRHHHDLARPAADREIGEHRHLVRVPVVRVVRRVLEVPLQRAGVRIERDERIGVEVGAGPALAVPVGVRVAGAPVKKVQRGIVGAGEPRRRAAALPDVALPGVAARLARRRNRVEAPEALAGLRIVGVDEAAVRELAAGDADDHLVVDDERRAGARRSRPSPSPSRCRRSPCRSSSRARRSARRASP